MCLSIGLVHESLKTGYRSCNKAFDSQQEQLLRGYGKRVVDLSCGLSTRELRKLLYHRAVRCKLKFPQKWCGNEMAGIGWLNAFLKINFSQTTRPEATSLAWAVNRENNNIFIENLCKFLVEIN